ncbi:MAG: hypothetical protein ACLPPF_22565 [Rhodomicrobium sp.]
MSGFMIEMMALMMPYMKILLYIGLIASAAGIGFAAAKSMIASEMRLKGLLWSGRVAVGMGLFFFACQLMGAMLGAAPGINLADANKFEFWIVPFWQPGAILFAAGLLIGNILAHARNGAATA